MSIHIGIPKGFTVAWSGTDATTPEGCFAVVGTDSLGNRTGILYRGDQYAPEEAELRGRIVWTETGNLVYRWWNAYIGSNLAIDDAFARIIAVRPSPTHPTEHPMADTAEHRVHCHQLATARRAQGRPSWEGRLNLTDVFHNDALTLTQKRDAIVARIKHLAAYKRAADIVVNHMDSDDYWDAESIVELVDEMAVVETVKDFDAVWDAFYDWADEARIWIATI